MRSKLHYKSLDEYILLLKNEINFGREFSSWYDKIVKDFKFDIEKDRGARDFLAHIISERHSFQSIESVLFEFKAMMEKKQDIFIYGCGPSLEETISYILKEKCKDSFSKAINLVADGASVLLKELEIPIEGTFTDLDGIHDSIFAYSRFMIVHAHGDNIEKIRHYETQIVVTKNLIATTQVESLENVINTGGFTDGDRILFFIKHFLKPYHRIYLIGMDFNKLIGKYSKPNFEKNVEANPIKAKKLGYAIKLIEWFKSMIENKIYLVNSSFHSEKLINLSLEDFSEIEIFQNE